jgi:tetratricopeptide (TPR) repeat protein
LKGEATAQSRRGQHQAAIQTWQKVLETEPTASNYVALADALLAAGLPGESLGLLVKAADLDGVAEVHLRLATVLARLGRRDESALARATYERLRFEDFSRTGP